MGVQYLCLIIKLKKIYWQSLISLNFYLEKCIKILIKLEGSNNFVILEEWKFFWKLDGENNKSCYFMILVIFWSHENFKEKIFYPYQKFMVPIVWFWRILRMYFYRKIFNILFKKFHSTTKIKFLYIFSIGTKYFFTKILWYHA